MVLPLSRRFTRFVGACGDSPRAFNASAVLRLLAGEDEYAPVPEVPKCSRERRARLRRRAHGPLRASDASREFARACVAVGMPALIGERLRRETAFHALHIWRLRARLRAMLRAACGHAFLRLLERVRRRRALAAAALLPLLACARRRLLLAHADALLAALERVRVRRRRTRQLFRAALAEHVRRLRRALAAVAPGLLAALQRARERRAHYLAALLPLAARARSTLVRRDLYEHIPYVAQMLLAGARMHTFGNWCLQLYAGSLAPLLARDVIAQSGASGTALDRLQRDVQKAVLAVIHQQACIIDDFNGRLMPTVENATALIAGALLALNGHLTAVYRRLEPRLKRGYRPRALELLRSVEDAMFLSAAGAVMHTMAMRLLTEDMLNVHERLVAAVARLSLDPTVRNEVSLPPVSHSLSAGMLAHRHRFNSLNPLLLVRALGVLSDDPSLQPAALLVLDRLVEVALKQTMSAASLRARVANCFSCDADRPLADYMHPSREFTLFLPEVPRHGWTGETVMWRDEDGSVRTSTADAQAAGAQAAGAQTAGAQTVRVPVPTAHCRACLPEIDNNMSHTVAFFNRVAFRWTLQNFVIAGALAAAKEDEARGGAHGGAQSGAQSGVQSGAQDGALAAGGEEAQARRRRRHARKGR